MVDGLRDAELRTTLRMRVLLGAEFCFLILRVYQAR
jgi:hypothetical protein